MKFCSILGPCSEHKQVFYDSITKTWTTEIVPHLDHCQLYKEQNSKKWGGNQKFID